MRRWRAHQFILCPAMAHKLHEAIDSLRRYAEAGDIMLGECMTCRAAGFLSQPGGEHGFLGAPGSPMLLDQRDDRVGDVRVRGQCRRAIHDQYGIGFIGREQNFAATAGSGRHRHRR